MDLEDLKDGAASHPLLQDDDQTSPAGESNVSLLRGGGSGGLEQDDDAENTPPQERRQIPTLVFIIVPMILFIICIFLAAAFMPPAPKHEEDQQQQQQPSPPKMKLHDDPVAPTLLSIRDHNVVGGLLNVHDNDLYRQLKHATFHETENVYVMLSSGSKTSANISLLSDKKEVGFGDALTLTWANEDETRLDIVNDEDILALYCPAGEADATKFRDAATIAQARATHEYHHGTTSDNNWSIPSFPIVREESCEFRLYAHDGKRGQDLDHHYYTRIAGTGPISLTSSNSSPTGIHISLTGKASEMNIQFATGASGEPLVEIAKKSDVIPTTGVRRLIREASSEVNWTKLKGVTTSYVATDMCQEPATSTEPGFFVSPGHLHTVKATKLQANTEYVYRVGLGYGQGIKWSDKYFSFKSSPPLGAGASSPGKPVLTFLALADQGCPDSKHGAVQGVVDSPPQPTDPAHNVTQLITSMIDTQTINSISIIGDLSYANGAAHIWDAWTNMIQSYASRVPVMVGVGNHEYDHTEGGGGGKDPSGVLSAFGFQPDWGKGSFNNKGGECGVPVSKRFAAPDNGNGVFWYSYDQALVHTVMLSSEHNITTESQQYIWLEKDLLSVNRTITPWVVVGMHRPVYNSEMQHDWLGPMVAAGLQNEVEDLLYTFQVDLVLSGHYHSYFRSCDGLYLNKCDNGGPTYATVGTGGAPLGLALGKILPNEYTEFVDKEHWGVGRVSVFNESALQWEFVAVGGNVIDEVWLTRDRRQH